MSNNLSPEDAKNIWQTQPPEGVTIPVEELRRRALRLKAGARRGALIVYTAGAMQIAASIGRHYVEQSPYEPWVAAADFISLIVLLLYWPYLYVFGAKQLTLLNLTAATPGLEFYRRQLELQYTFFRYGSGGIPKLLLAVFVLFLRALEHPAVMIPIGLAGLAWGIFAYFQKRREFPAIQHELDELNAFRRGQG